MKPSAGSKFPFSPAVIICLIAGVTIIRTFLENFSNPEPVGGFTSFLLIINYFLFYSAVVLSLGIIVGIITKQSWMKTISIVTLGLPIIWIAPIVDLVLSGGACMAYISSTGVNLLKDIVVIFRPLTHCGATIGIRVEIVIIVLALARYIFKKNRSLIWGIIGGLASYLIIWVHSAVPGIIQTIAGSADPSFFRELLGNSLLGSVHSFSSGMGAQRFVEQIAFFMGRIPWLLLLPLITLVAFHEYRHQTLVWFRNMQVTRVVYYLLLGISGMVLAMKTSDAAFPVAFPDLLAFVIFFACIILNAWIAIIINNDSDVVIDDINSLKRPFGMRQLAIVCGTLLMSGGLLVNWNVFALLAVAQVCYVAYSMPPLRLKRHYLSSSFLVGCAGIATILAGYFFLAPGQTFSTLPYPVVIIMFVTLAIFSNVKDFKDVAGDRAEGIQTMPVVFGTKKAGVILSLGTAVWILTIAVIVQSILVASFILPIIILDFIIRKKVPEYFRFVIVFVEIVLLLIVL